MRLPKSPELDQPNKRLTHLINSYGFVLFAWCFVYMWCYKENNKI